VVVTNPDDQSGQLDDAFTVYPQGSGAPKITSITPNGGNAGETVSITDLAGENFIDGATVKLARTGQTDINGTNITVVNANQITCDFDIPSNAVIGPWTVMVTNPDTQTAQLVDGFIVYGGEGPTVTSIDPDNGVQGETIAIINLIGTNFIDGATVKLTRVGQPDIDATNVVVANSNYISCSIAIPMAAEVGAWHVVVTNIDTQSGQLDNAFTVYAPGTAPTITAITPDNGDRDTTVSVTIDGTNFADGITAKLARTAQPDMNATNVNFVNANQITCDFDIPANAVTGPWTLMVTNPDRQTGSLVDGFRVNPGGQVTINNVTIVRDADDPGSSVTVSWQTDPVHSSVDIYCQERPADVALTAAEFNDPSNWTLVANPVIIQNGNLDTFTDANQVGTGTQKYYTIEPQGQAADPTTNVVGKFDLIIGPEPEKLFVSIPVEPSNTSLDAVIGGQVVDSDMIIVFNIDKEADKGAIRMAGNWQILPGAPAIVDNLELGNGYAYWSQTARYITVVGNVRETELTRTLTANSTANWIATPYPFSFGIADAGLNNSSFDSNPVNAAMAVHYDANAEAIGGTDGIAFHYDAAEWRDGTLTNPSPLTVAPGKSYMLYDPGTNDVAWTINR
jgi:hypothetical protein